MNLMNEYIHLFDRDWKFHLGVPASGVPWRHFWKAGYTIGPAARQYNDTAWQTVDLPHDWGMDLDYDYTVDIHHGALPIATGKKKNAHGFYRKSFEVPAEWSESNISLVFDGVYRDCELWVNGQYVTRNVAGYVGFNVDISDLLFYGETNNIALHVDASQQEGWFYEGAGIYRHVWLRVMPSVHIIPESVFIHSEIIDGDAIVSCDFAVANTGGQAIHDTAAFQIGDVRSTTAFDASEYSETSLHLSLRLEQFISWDLDHPHLYTCLVSLPGQIYRTRTGIRDSRFDAEEGFFLNGRHRKILGSCTHQDFAVTGVALSDDVQRYKMNILKKYGFNANRTAHNPPAPEMLDACDEAGLLVMCEARLFGSTPEALSQLQRMVVAGRNHPSVILWSLGNEEIIQATDSAMRQASRAKRLIRDLDPTRPVTYAANNGDELQGINEVVDVRGVNYLNITRDIRAIDAYHASRPHQPLVGSEESSCLGTRGVYVRDKKNGYVENLDNCGPGYFLGAEALWQEYMKRKYLAGAFVWTGIDYRGEASKQAYITNFGVIDLAGFPKATAHYFKAMNTQEPYLYLYPHWNRKEPEGTDVPLRVYTNVDRVSLSLNGKPQGDMIRESYASLTFNLPYYPGIVEAVGYRKGEACITTQLRTALKPAVLSATCERVGETAFVVVEVKDKYGTPCPEASNRLTFKARGARILGASNGNPSDEDKEKASAVYAYMPLKAFRIWEWRDDAFYSDQNLTEIIGQTDKEWHRNQAQSFLPVENDTVQSGVQRFVPAPKKTGEDEPAMTVACSFWLEQSDTDATSLHIGYLDGHAVIDLNGTVVFQGSGDEDGLNIAVSGLLNHGVNELSIELYASINQTYAIGKGIKLVRPTDSSFSRRLFHNRCLCMVQAPNGGVLHISADGLPPLLIDLE